MPPKTTLKCPNCKSVGQTSNAVTKGAKVRCPRCGHPFRFTPSQSEPEDDLRTVGDLDLGRFSEFFTPEATPSRIPATDEPEEHYRGITNEQFVPNPLAPASERSKDAFIGGKQVRFYSGRKATAVFLIFLLSVALYGGAIGMHALMTALQGEGAARQRAQEERDKALIVQAGEAKKKADSAKKNALADAQPDAKTGALANAKAGAQPNAHANTKPEIPAPAAPPRPRTNAGDPLRIGDLEVTVKNVRQGILDPAQAQPRLAITLSITNHAKQQSSYLYSSDPANGVAVRFLTADLHRFKPIEPAKPKEKIIKAGEMIEDVLVFPETLPFAGQGLELDLPILGIAERFAFHIPKEFIESAR